MWRVAHSRHILSAKEVILAKVRHQLLKSFLKNVILNELTVMKPLIHGPRTDIVEIEIISRKTAGEGSLKYKTVGNVAGRYFHIAHCPIIVLFLRAPTGIRMCPTV